jgi:hypothetical protein
MQTIADMFRKEGYHDAIMEKPQWVEEGEKGRMINDNYNSLRLSPNNPQVQGIVICLDEVWLLVSMTAPRS